MSDCLFCKIIQKQIPATIVEETDQTLAFRDIHPRAPVHVLVVPKEHVSSILDFKPTHGPLPSAIHQTIQSVARKEKVDTTGFRVVVNTGKDSGQLVSHIHYHVIGGRPLEK